MLHIAKRVREFFPIFSVLALVLIIFVPSLRTGYFADDFDFAVRLPKAPFVEMLTLSTDGTRGGGSWRPLTMVSLWLTMSEHQSPAFNHAVSLALYLCLLALVYGCVRKLFPDRSTWFAALVTLIGGLMPIHAEPVIWIAARGDLLAAIFAMAALYAWLQGRGWLSVGMMALSLLSKEMWILFGFAFIMFGPAEYSIRERIKYGVGLSAVIAVWFLVRFNITHFGVGGYSITAGQQILGVQHLANEVIGFFLGSWNYGEVQSFLVRFSQFYWFIIIWLLGAAGAACTYASFHNQRARFLCASLAALLLPILALGVPFVRPEMSVGEQRYWFAPSIFLVLLFAHASVRLQLKVRNTILIVLCVIYISGMNANIKLFQGAAVYRDEVLTGWKTAVGPAAIHTQVALLPDSWYGVHLLASPFFERALEYETMSPPHSVAAWYQWCTAWCLSPVTADRTGAESVHLFAQDPRIFSSTSHGLRHDINQKIENGTSLAIWSGASWIQFSAAGVENRRP